MSTDRRSHVTKLCSTSFTAPSGKLFKIGDSPPKKTMKGQEIYNKIEKAMWRLKDTVMEGFLGRGRDLDAKGVLNRLIDKGYVKVVDE